MEKDTLTNLTRRKVLASVGALGAGAALGGAGTAAFFSDQETFANNELVAGSLDLKVDWQQTYDGPLESPVYGDAGRPYVNAYPDKNGDGKQDPVLTREQIADEQYGTTDLGALTDEQRRAVEKSFRDQFADWSAADPPLIDLRDVKPGDEGEVTFSCHLFDNPGYVWMNGTLRENAENSVNDPEADDPDEDNDPGNDFGDPDMAGELSTAIRTRLWYDADCDNAVDEGEVPITPELSLGGLLSILGSDHGIPLDGAVGGDADGEPVFHPGTCPETSYDSVNAVGDSIDVDGETVTVPRNPKCTDFGLVQALKIGATEDDGDLPGDGNTQTYQTPYGDVRVTQSGETVTWKTDASPDGSFAAGEQGFCVSKVIVKGGRQGSANVYSYDVDDAPSSGDSQPLQTDTGQDISHVSFCVDLVPTQDGGDGRECFPNSTTTCFGFEWWLPADHANEIQTDSVAFDLGFYTEQCRHNDGTGLPTAGNQEVNG